MDKKILVILMLFPILLFGITLQESINLGMKNNKEIKLAGKEIEEAKMDSEVYKSKLFPQISLTAGVQYKREDLPADNLPEKVNIVSNLGNIATHNDSMLANTMSYISNSMIPEKVSTTTGFMGNLELNQVLFAGKRIINSVKISKRLIQLKEYNLMLKKRELKKKITNSYNSILLLQKVLEVNRSAFNLADEHLQQVQAMYKNGLVSEYDLLRAKLEKSKLNPNVIEAENNLSLAKEAFKKLIGITKEPVITGDLQIKVINLSDEKSYIQDGLTNRLEIKSAKEYEKIMNKTVDINRASFLPNFILKADWQLYSGLDDTNFHKSEFGNTATVQLGFQYNLFSGKSDMASLKKAKISYRKSRISTSNLRDLISLEIKNNYKIYKKELVNLSLNKENLQLAKKGFKIANARYQNKVGIQLEVFDAQVQLKVAKLKYFQSKYNLIKAENDLLVSIGK